MEVVPIVIHDFKPESGASTLNPNQSVAHARLHLPVPRPQSPPVSAAPNKSTSEKLRSKVRAYFHRMKASDEGTTWLPKFSGLPVMAHMWITSFVGIAILLYISQEVSWFYQDQHMPLISGSFGASAVLLYGTIKSPLGQPRNAFFGHIVSAAVGLVVREIFDGHVSWLAGAVAVSSALVAMDVLGCVHPPGGATSLLAIIGPDARQVGWLYMVFPTALGILIMLVIAVIFNNFYRQYPVAWFFLHRASPPAPAPSPPSQKQPSEIALEPSKSLLHIHPDLSKEARWRHTTDVEELRSMLEEALTKVQALESEYDNAFM